MSGCAECRGGKSGLVPVGLACQDPLVEPIKLAETAPGEYSLSLVAGATDVDGLISELGHDPNGYFWEGIVELLVTTEAPRLKVASRPIPRVEHSSPTATIEVRSRT
jgi:hypothetical protein